MANVQHIYKGAGAPVTAPAQEGHHYVDVTGQVHYVSVGTGSTSDWIQVGSTPTGNANDLAGFDGSGLLHSLSGWQYDPVYKGINQNITMQPDADGSASMIIGTLNFDPLQNSVAESYNWRNYQIYIDPNSTGFDLGTGGQFVSHTSLGINHLGTSNTGAIDFMRFGLNIGNGTDAITVGGIGYVFGQGAVNANVTVTGQIQGYGFQINVNAAATLTNGINAFYDFATINTAVDGYNSVLVGPVLAEITNNHNYVAYNSNPTITLCTGNAGVFGFAFSPVIGTMGTGGFNGISISPSITSCQNATGLYINMNGVTGTNVKAIDVNGDVNINGDLTFTGALSIGQLNAFYAHNVSDGGGNPQSIHGLISSVNALASTTTANCDTIGVNTAMLVSIAANSINTSGPIGLGFSALALPCVVETHTGSSLDFMSGAVYAVNLSGTSTGGTITTVNLCRSLVIPNGITTITNVRGYFYQAPFGSPGTNEWGFYSESDCANFFKGNLKIGGTVGFTDQVTNTDIGLEVEEKLVVIGRGDTALRDAKTAINGALWYNTDTDKFQGYASGAWVDLH